MGYEISDMTELAHEGSTQPLTTTPVVGTPVREYESVLHTGAGPVAEGELRVTVLREHSGSERRGYIDRLHDRGTLWTLGRNRQDGHSREKDLHLGHVIPRRSG